MAMWTADKSRAQKRAAGASKKYFVIKETFKTRNYSLFKRQEAKREDEILLCSRRSVSTTAAAAASAPSPSLFPLVYLKEDPIFSDARRSQALTGVVRQEELT